MSTKNIILISVAVLFVGYVVWIGGKPPVPQAPLASTKTTTETKIETKKELSPNTTNTNKTMTIVTMTTNKGAITLELFNNLAPKTVENFTTLANKGFYNGTRFHRVIKGFMIQGGDPLSKDIANQNSWGTGGPGYSFADEIHANNNNNIGTIAMANAGPNTNGSQFFINVANNNFLDTKHTVFGRVTAGMEVVNAIENTKTAPGDRPVEDMIVEKVEVK